MTDITTTHDPVDRLAEDFLVRYRRGERPSISEYAKQFPDVADQVADVIQVLLLMENLVDEQANDSDPVPLPEKLGDYRILRELGRGGMGIVYEAVQEELGRHVAIKVLSSSALLKSTHIERFRREAKAAAKLHHTNIVPVFGVGVQDGIHYYAMQYIQGHALDTVLREVQQQRTKSSSGDTLRDAVPSTSQTTISGYSSRYDYARTVGQIIHQIAEALTHAHSQGVLHRDIKPSNILLDQEGRAWLSDFGLAQVETSDQLTGTGDIVGTLRYIAPERFKRQADERCDIYSLGMTLYELMTLRTPFLESDRAKLIHQILKEEPLAPRKVDPAVPRDLETIILKSITKEPEHRYQTSQALAEDLSRFLADRPVAARRLQWWERSWRWVQRNRALSITIAFAFTALVLGLAMTYGQWQRAEFHASQQKLTAEAAQKSQHQAEANAALAWKGFSSVLDGLNSGSNKPVSVLRRDILQQALKLHQEYLSTVNDAPRSYEMGRIANELGNMWNAIDDDTNAEKHYLIAIQIFETLVDSQPQNVDFQLELGIALGDLAALVVPNMPLDAETIALKSINMLRAAVKAKPDVRFPRYRLAFSLETLAIVSLHKEEVWEPAIKEAIQHLQQLLAVPPAPKVDDMSLMSKCRHTYAKILLNRNRLDEALIEVQAAVKAAERLARQFPKRDDVQEQFSGCSNTMGTILSQQKEFSRAEELYRRNITLYRSLLQRDPQNADLHSNLGGALSNLAIILGNLNQFQEAIASIDEAVKEQRIALQGYPNHKQYQKFHYQHHTVRVQLHLQKGDHSHSADLAQQLAKLPREQGVNHIDSASFLCQSADLALRDQKLKMEDRKKLAEGYYDKAMHQLRSAIERGFSDKVRFNNQDFEALKTRNDFVQLLTKMPAQPAKTK